MAARSGMADATTPGSWRDRFWAWRDRTLASPSFQRWAARFPLTRPVARARARALFDICAGFVYAQVLYACVELRLLETLAERPRTVAELASRLGLSREATIRLVLAAVSLELVAKRRGGRFGLGGLGAAMLGNPGIAAMIRHHRLLYGDLADPVALLRGERVGTGLGRYWAYAGATEPGTLELEAVRAYTDLMAASQPMVAAEVLDAYSLRQHRRLLDIGGGDGTFLAAVGARWPHMELAVFDLPAVAARAGAQLTAGGLGGRVTATGGDFFRDPLPKGADIVSLLRVIHDHDDSKALVLLQRVREALLPGGTLLLAEPLAATAGAEPVGHAYFGFYLLAMGSGRPRAEDELRAFMNAAGFDRVRRLPTATPMLTSVLIARAAVGRGM